MRKVRFKLQEFSADLTCHVVELADIFGVIFGEDWLSKYSLTMSYEHNHCVLTRGSQRFTVFPGPDNESVDKMQTGPAAHVAPLTAIWTAVNTGAPVNGGKLMSASTAHALLHEFGDRFPESAA